MNITDVNVSPGILSFQSFLPLGRIKLEGNLKLITAIVRIKIIYYSLSIQASPI